MEWRPPEVVDIVSGESFKLACMACIRGHRTKHCGGNNCRDKILWTIKRPGRPSNSCMCKFSGTGRCKCVLAKSQCPHKPKKGEKKTVDCRCDERGRLCCSLTAPEWDMIGRKGRPGVRLFRNLEDLMSGFSSHAMVPPTSANTPHLHHGQSPASIPQTPAASVGGFASGSGGSTPQTPMNVLRNPVAPSLPQAPNGGPMNQFGMMGLGAPMGSEGHVGQGVLAWQGHTPIAPAPRPPYSTPQSYSEPRSQVQPAFSTPLDPSLSMTSYTFDNSISQPPLFSPQHTPAHLQSHPQTPMFSPPPPQIPSQQTFDTIPPVTASLSDLTVTPHGTLPPLTGFDMDYFNFQFPGAICQQCGMADCTCRSCPTVLQNTMDGSWQQCCSRKHVHFGQPGVGVQAGTAAKKGCCGSKGYAGASLTAPNTTQSATVSTAVDGVAPVMDTRDAGGCCAGSSSTAEFAMDPFDFNTQPPPYYQHRSPLPIEQNTPLFTASSPSNGLLFDPGAPLSQARPPDPTQQQHFASTADQNLSPDFKQDPLPNWTEPEDIDMDFDEFIQEMGCGCGTDCPCGMEQEDSLEMDLGGDPGGGQIGEESEEVEGGGGGGVGAVTPARNGFCGA